MKRNRRQGVSGLEFALGLLVLTPLLLGTSVTGINMIRTLQVIQLARDAGHMYARGIDFGKAANKAVLASLGADLGLSTTSGSGSAVVILSALTYVDENLCASAGAADSDGNPTSECTNYQKWVFTQRLTVGNSSVRRSNFGAPVTSGSGAVTVDSSTGKITLAQYVKKSGAVATFSGVNPYQVVNGSASGLPSGQLLYVAEAAAAGFNLPPFVSNAVAYSWGLF